MSDISQTQLDSLIATMNRSAWSMNSAADALNKGSMSRDQAARKLANDLSSAERGRVDAINKGSKSLSGAYKEADTFSAKLAVLGGGLGVMFASFIKWGDQTIDVYREMAEVGQTFNGSMIEMSRAAAQAGLPLKDFANAIKANKYVVAQLGASGKGSFGDLAKKVRIATEANAMYGMSMQDLTSYSGEYLEIQRISGQLNKKNDAKTVKGITDMVASISTMAQITGEAREEILSRSKEALSQVEVTATMNQNAQRGMSMYNDALMKSVNELAAQPGEAGKFLSKGMADTFSHFGQAFMTDAGKDFIKAGVGGATGVLDEAARRIQAGEDATTVNMEMVSKLKKMLDNPETLESLKLQAIAGNESAKSILRMSRDLKEYTKADIARAAKASKNTDMITSIFGSFTSVFERLKGSFIDGLLAPLGEIFSDPKSIKAWQETFKSLEEPMKQFGIQFGSFVKDILTPGNIKNLVNGLVDVTKGVGAAAKVGFDFAKGFFKIVSGINKFWSMFDKMDKGFAGLMTGLTLVGGFLATKFIGSILGSFIKNKIGLGAAVVNVNAKTVRINGAGGGGGGGRRSGGGVADAIEDAAEDSIDDRAGNTKPPRERGRKRGMMKRAWKNRKAIGGLVGKMPRAAMGYAKKNPGQVLKAGAKGVGFGLLAGLATDMVANAAMDKLGIKGDDKKALGDIASNGATGAAFGAQIGGLFGPLGALVGGVGGGIVGGLVGAATNFKTVKKWIGGFGKSVGTFFAGMWDWLNKAEWLKPILNVMSYMTPVGLAKHAFDLIKGAKPKTTGGTLGDPEGVSAAPEKKGFFSNLFAPRASGVKTPVQPASPRMAEVKQQQVAKNDAQSEAMMRKMQEQIDATNRQTAVMSRLLKEQNNLGRQGVAAAQNYSN